MNITVAFQPDGTIRHLLFGLLDHQQRPGPRIVIEAWREGADQKWDLVEIDPKTLTM